MLATEKHKATYIAPVGIGLAVFAAVLAYVLSYPLSLNAHCNTDPNKRPKLHRRSTESCAFIRYMRRARLVSWIPLDILGRTRTGGAPGGCFLPVDQEAGVLDCIAKH